MNNLSKSQKDEMATSLAVLALYDGGVSYKGYECECGFGCVFGCSLAVVHRGCLSD